MGQASAKAGRGPHSTDEAKPFIASSRTLERWASTLPYERVLAEKDVASIHEAELLVVCGHTPTKMAH